MSLSTLRSARTARERRELFPPRPGRILQLLSIAAAFLAVLPATWAEETAKQNFDLPAENAEATLRQFAVQARKQVIFPTDLVEGNRMNAVRG